MNGTIRQQQSKAMDMRFYWLKDRVTQRMLKAYWAPGKVNLGDYFSKHHPSNHVKKVRKLYVNEPDSPRTISACNKILAQWIAYKGALIPWIKSGYQHVQTTDSNSGRTGKNSLLNTSKPSQPLEHWWDVFILGHNTGGTRTRFFITPD